jgi:4-hydroxy-2-oxovalerate aldolase
MAESEVQILDTTLRDGSYVIDFQFTAQDTALIASTLESAGIPWIEIAHGLGLGAARAGKGDQAATDEEYLNAAANSLTTSKFGTFFIPGIGTEDDLRLAADCGAHFIRIGTNVNEVEQAAPYFELAKKLGLITFSNLMKSYAVPPNEFAAHGHTAEQSGADYLCIVDSAGGMLPDDVRAYFDAAHEKVSIPVCFHGHNNLSMAVANSLQAVESGAAIVDASLQGMGRSEGNTMTEILVAILQKKGICESIDVNALLDISQALIRPIMHNSGYSPMGVTYGRAKFHNSFIGRILDAADQFKIDPRDLILKVTEHNQVDAPVELVEEMARQIQQQPAKSNVAFSLAPPRSMDRADLLTETKARAAELKEKARKQCIPSVFNIVVGSHEEAHVSPFVETTYGCAISNIMLSDASLLTEIVEACDAFVDYILLDSGDARLEEVNRKHAQILHYSDTEAWSRATVSHVTQLLDGCVNEKHLLLLGDENLVASANQSFTNIGASTYGQHSTIPEKLDAVIALSPRKPIIDADRVQRLSEDTLLFDAGIGSLHPEAIIEAEKRGLRVVRIDFRPTIAAVARELIHMRGVVKNQMGRGTWDGVGVVAGGVIGNRGEIIVDNFSHPTRIIGVADGTGGIESIDESSKDIQAVRASIMRQQLKQASD